MIIDDITSLIPQRPPILMVDRFHYEDEDLCHSELTVKEDNMFLHNGSIVPEGLLEHIASPHWLPPQDGWRRGEPGLHWRHQTLHDRQPHAFGRTDDNHHDEGGFAGRQHHNGLGRKHYRRRNTRFLPHETRQLKVHKVQIQD